MSPEELLTARPVRTRIMHLTVALGVSAAALTACGDGSDEGGSEAAGTVDGGSGDLQPTLADGWHHVVGDFEAVSSEVDPQLPVTVTDGSGETVEVKDADRIISAGDGISSILGALGLGDKIHAAPEESTSPEGIAADQHFEFNKSTGTEGLLAMDGTLFIGDNVARHGDVAAKFRDAGVDAVVIDDQASQAEKIQAVANYVGLSDAGGELVDSLEADMKEAQEIVSREDLSDKKVIQVTATGAGGQNSVAGVGVPGTEMVEDLGMESVGVESGLRGFSREFSNEGILAEEPDVIVLAESDYEKWGGEEGMWSAFPTLRQTPAGERPNVIVMPDAQLGYSSPELGAGAKALAGAISELY